MSLPEPFQQLVSETSRAFAAFVVYRDLGPSRSIREASNMLGRSTRQLKEWSRRWSWPTRAESWDRHLDQIRTNTTEEQRRAMVERHVQLAVAGQAKLVERLQDADAIRVRSLSEWARTLSDLVKVERLSRGLPIEHAQLHHTAPPLGDIIHPAAAAALRKAQAMEDEAPKDDLHGTDPKVLAREVRRRIVLLAQETKGTGRP